MIGTAFEERICEGTLQQFDQHVDALELELARPRNDAPIVVYWLDDVTEQCGEGRSGCFFPGTRVLFSTGPSITHEIVHAVLDSTAKTYFVEEGMAEIYSGVDVWYRPERDDGRPLDKLRLTKEAYRSGRLDYAAAAHFMRFVHDRKGEFGMRRLAEDIVDGADAPVLAETLESIFQQSIDEIEDEYFERAPVYYRGFAAQEVPPSRAAEGGDHVHLQCDDDGTRGPLVQGGGGLYTVRQLHVQRGGLATIRVDGEAGGWVELLRPASGAGLVTNWSMPRASVDPRAIHLECGESTQQELERGIYLAVFGADADDTDVSLEVEIPLPDAVGREGT